jgi:NADH-quinone oxidoreductase subunit L
VKAFWTTKAGDVGLLIGIVLLYRQAGTFDFLDLLAWCTAGLRHSPGSAPSPSASTCAVGKSAQFPLHVWLPDAMEGPTPPPR